MGIMNLVTLLDFLVTSTFQFLEVKSWPGGVTLRFCCYSCHMITVIALGLLICIRHLK